MYILFSMNWLLLKKRVGTSNWVLCCIHGWAHIPGKTVSLGAGPHHDYYMGKATIEYRSSGSFAFFCLVYHAFLCRSFWMLRPVSDFSARTKKSSAWFHWSWFCESLHSPDSAWLYIFCSYSADSLYCTVCLMKLLPQSFVIFIRVRLPTETFCFASLSINHLQKPDQEVFPPVQWEGYSTKHICSVCVAFFTLGLARSAFDSGSSVPRSGLF